MEKNAILDSTKKYRYTLERWWGADRKNFVNFILLNPSTADATKDDPTVRACVDFAKRWNFDGLVMTNLFALRETSPTKMKTCQFPHGLENDAHIKRVAAKAKMVVLAWGSHGNHCGRDREVLELISRIVAPVCLKITADGQPGHPLYIKRTTRPKPYPIKKASI